MIDVKSPMFEKQARRPSDIDDMFEMYFGPRDRASKAIGMQGDIGWRPATDVYETEDEFIVQVDLAGMQRDEIEVIVDAGFLIIKGTRRNIAPPGKKHFHKMEIQVGPFERHVRLPEPLDPMSARATYRSGFLFVQLKHGSGSSDKRRSVPIESD